MTTVVEIVHDSIAGQQDFLKISILLGEHANHATTVQDVLKISNLLLTRFWYNSSVNNKSLQACARSLHLWRILQLPRQEQ